MGETSNPSRNQAEIYTVGTEDRRHGADLAIDDRMASGAAIASSGSAVLACAACCVLPLAWPAVGLVLTGGFIAWLETAQPYITALAAIPVLAGWFLVWRQWRTRGKRLHLATLPAMTAASALLLVALFWLEIEPLLIRALTPGAPS